MTSCPVTLAATMKLGAWEDMEEPSKDRNKIQRDASPYPQLPMGHDQTCFGIEEGPKTTPLYAPPDACASSDATAEHMQALFSTASLLTVQVFALAPLPCMGVAEPGDVGIYSNAPSMHLRALSCAICAQMKGIQAGARLLERCSTPLSEEQA